MEKRWTNPRSNICEFQCHDFKTAEYYEQQFQNTDWQRLETAKAALDFGVWINPTEMKIITFANGGEVVTVCNDLDSFKAELTHLRDFYNRL